MHKLDLNNNRENKQEISDVELLLLMEMGFFSDLKKLEIKFNPRPISNPIHLKNKELFQKPKEKIIDLHLNLIKKIDDLIEDNKGLSKIDQDPLSLKQINSPLPNIVEIREPALKTLEMPALGVDLKPDNFDADIGQREEFFEIEFPKVDPNDTETNEEILSWMLNEKEAKKSFWGSGRIKVRGNDKETKIQPKENNGVTKTKLELEKTKKEIEAKKIALEEAIEEEKQKEIELKREREEKIKQEKLKKLELKKKQKEEKIKQREALKLQKKKEKEQIRQEKLKTKKHTKKSTNLIKKEPELAEPDIAIDDKKEIITETQILDQDVAKLMPILDSLFDNLPENIVETFAQSKDFELYEKVMSKYTNK